MKAIRSRLLIPRIDHARERGYNGCVMNKKCTMLIISVLAIFVAVIVPSFAQQSDSNTWSLAYGFDAGEVIRYRIIQRITGTRTLPGATNPTPVDSELTAVIAIRLVKSLADGVMEIAADTESASLKLSGREPRSLPPSKLSRLYRIDRSGRPVPQTQEADKPKPTVSRSVLDPAWIEPIAILAALPQKPIALQDEWCELVANPLDADSKIEVMSKLTETKQTNNGWIAIIEQTHGFPKTDAEDSPESEGSRVEGRIVVKFLPDRKRVLSTTGELTTILRTPMALPGLPAGDLPMGSATALRVEQYQNQFTVETLPPAAKTSGQK